MGLRVHTPVLSAEGQLVSTSMQLTESLLESNEKIEIETLKL